MAGHSLGDIEWMLCIPCPQSWFNLSDPTVEETWYAPRALWDVLEIDLADEPVLDETTICKF